MRLERQEGREPFAWRRRTPEVRDLERLWIELAPARVEAGAEVLIGETGHDRSFLWHWAQYLHPRANFLFPDDVPHRVSPWLLARECPQNGSAGRGAIRTRYFCLVEQGEP